MFNPKISQTISCRIDLRAVDTAVKQQREAGKRVTLADTECRGLRLVVNASSASWTYAYRKRGFSDGGKRYPQRTMKLGDLKTMSAANARLQADQIKAAVRDGLDPAVETRAEKRLRDLEAARRTDLATLLDRYITESLNAGTKHHTDETAHSRKALSEMGVAGLKPGDLTVKDIRRLLDMHKDRPATAQHRFGALSRFLDYLVDEQFLSVNPALSIARKRKPKSPPPKERYYEVDEVQTLWHSADNLKPVYRDYLRFLMVLPLRSTEAAELTWPQVNTDCMEIRLSAAGTKNNSAFTMPITDMAKTILDKAKTAGTARAFQLSNKTNAPMTAWTHFQQMVQEVSGIKDFARHDLRRTFSSQMGNHSDFDEALIDSLLNHRQSATRSGVMRHYQQAQRLQKRREVMEQWDQLLSGWVSL